MENFGERIKRLRKEKGLTQSGLANKLSMKYQSIQQWEANKTKPTQDMLMNLAEIFDCSIEAILTGNTSAQDVYKTKYYQILEKNQELMEELVKYQKKELLKMEEKV
ncbi:MAG: helix-turn-helix transcriptional regulator [Pseudarcicella sp.]|jgi:transcriptional regulator with XRE-family HTH domain|nr:helix-turn-helix transcriptional regulator [Pseudarcicella sp.]MBP6411605.1 helix-turn-helix transcriptional regulator [Pseudarcicella sp.]